MVELMTKNAIIPVNKYVKEAGGWNFLDQFFRSMFGNEINRQTSSADGDSYALFEATTQLKRKYRTEKMYSPVFNSFEG
jgi:hypothetical protein